jgi:hypothetical protein
MTKKICMPELGTHGRPGGPSLSTSGIWTAHGEGIPQLDPQLEPPMAKGICMPKLQTHWRPFGPSLSTSGIWTAHGEGIPTA